MTAQRPDRPVTVREEVALAETRDLPPRVDGVERLDPIANAVAIAETLKAESSHDPRGYRRHRGDR